MNNPVSNLVSCIALVIIAVATNPNAAAADTSTTLKDAYKNYFYVGVAINRTIATGTAARVDNVNRSPDAIERDTELTREQFNQISPENDLKWALIQPREGPNGYNFGPADAYVNFGLSNHMYIVGHTLVWHGQTPAWVFAGTNLPPEATKSPVRASVDAEAKMCPAVAADSGAEVSTLMALTRHARSCCNGCTTISPPSLGVTKARSRYGMW